MPGARPHLLLLAALVGFLFPDAPGLPAFSVKDCRGKVYTDFDFRARGLVLVVTAPTYAQGDAQKAWNRALDPLAWPEGGPYYAFLQDLSQSWFRGVALAEMRQRYDPPPLLLVDEDGSVRAALGFPAGATLVAAYAPGGRLVGVETNGASAVRAKNLWGLARQARPAPGRAAP